MTLDIGVGTKIPVFNNYRSSQPFNLNPCVSVTFHCNIISQDSRDNSEFNIMLLKSISWLMSFFIIAPSHSHTQLKNM